MRPHRTAVRPYRGGKRRVPVHYRDLSNPDPKSEHPVGRPGDPDGPGHLVDLAFDPNQPRDSRGRWAETRSGSLDKVIHGDVSRLEALVHADQGPTRIEMPQLSGVPLPGSKADAIPHEPGQEVDLTAQFEAELRARGYLVHDTSVPTSRLKPTQDQLVMSKVIGIANYMLSAPANSPVWEPIFVSKDNHVIDGHHRWAARTVRDDVEGLDHDRMDVRKINVSIAKALRLASDFMDEWGLPRAGVTGQTTTVSNFAPSRDVALAFDPNQPRDAQGQWTASASNVVSMWNRATAGEKTAGEQWYPMAHQTALALSRKYGVSKEEAAGLLAAYSPQTPWGRDQIEASEALRYGHGVGGKKGAVWFTHDDPTVEDRVGIMATGNTRALADKVIAGGDFDTLTAGRNKDGSLKPGAPKIRAFYHLIAEGGQSDPNDPRVVIDRHAMSVAYGKRVTTEDYERMRPGSGKMYRPLVDVYVKAAKKISKAEGRTVTPETVQAVTWLAQQRENAAQVTRVGKTRKALGNRDWDEWTKYAQRYLGLDTASGAKVGYSDLANAYLNEIDLRFNPSQPRDEKGRWTETGKHKGASVKDIEDLLMPGAAMPTKIEDYPGPVGVEGDGGPVPEPSEQASWAEQSAAQEKASDWFSQGTYWEGEPPKGSTLRLWSDYQSPANYSDINKRLRKGNKALLKTARQMFEDAGYTTTNDMTVYRALRDDKGHDWAQTLTPGSTFEEDGIVSSTTFRRLAQGWLGLEGKANGENEDVSRIEPDDVVMEVKVPKGSRIVGGTTEFIETMLPPGTRFKIVSATRITTTAAVNPLNVMMSSLTGPTDPLTYTHVVAEAILPTEAK